MKRLAYVPLLLLSLGLNLWYGLPFLIPDLDYGGWDLRVLVLLYVCSAASLMVLARNPDGGYALMALALAAKVLLIPWFAVNFLFGVLLFFGGFIMPLNWFGLPGVVLADLLMLVLTSLYGSIGIYRFFSRHRMRYAPLWIALEWLYVFDLVSAVAAFVLASQQKKREKAANQADLSKRSVR
jgi:hypothetical protein